MEDLKTYTPEVVLQMIVDDVRQIKDTIHDQALRNEAAHQRLNDKLDALRDATSGDLRNHDRDIVRLTTRAEEAGKRSGLISGAMVSIIVGIILNLAAHLMNLP